MVTAGMVGMVRTVMTALTAVLIVTAAIKVDDINKCEGDYRFEEGGW